MSKTNYIDNYLNSFNLKFQEEKGRSGNQYFLEKCSQLYDLRELVVDCMQNNSKKYDNDMLTFKLQAASIIKFYQVNQKSGNKTFTKKDLTKTIEDLTKQYVDIYNADF